MSGAATQEVLFGIASQSFVLESSRPLASVGTVTVYEAESDDTGTAESATNGAASVGSLTTTSNAAAGAGETNPRFISLTSSASFVIGRRYYISRVGVGEAFEVARNDTAANDVYSRHPLANAYATGATVADTLRASIGVLDAWAAERGNVSTNHSPTGRYRVRWPVVYATLDGTTGATDVLYTNVDLVRYPASPIVSPLDMDDAMVGWLDGIDPDNRATRGEALIREATRLVKIDLLRGGVADQALRNAEVHADGVIRRCIYERTKSNAMRGAATDVQVEAAKSNYREWVEGLIGSPRLALDTTGGGGAKTKAGRVDPLFVRLG